MSLHAPMTPNHLGVPAVHLQDPKGGTDPDPNHAVGADRHNDLSHGANMDALC